MMPSWPILDRRGASTLLAPTEHQTGFGIYVHWPFCSAKCPYCDFNSHVRHTTIDQDRYLSALCQELAHVSTLTDREAVTSVFFGGGTPSLMEAKTVAGVLDSIAAHWTVSSDVEVTLEANPTSVEASRFRGYRSAGVNRVSLGVQSLRDDSLAKLGRLHSVDEAKQAIELARNLFPRLSFDLIYARSEQSVSDWRRELGEALSLAADHLSLYQLTIEDGTRFAELYKSGRLIMPDGEVQAQFYAATQELCEDAGLPAYEISNHAMPGAESRHNLTYWRYQDYAGVGPGAHGRLDDGSGKLATATERHPETWLGLVESQGHGLIETEYLSSRESADELLLMGLRLREGLALDRFFRAARKEPDTDRIEQLLSDGLLERMPDGKFRASRSGRFVLDTIITEIAA